MISNLIPQVAEESPPVYSWLQRVLRHPHHLVPAEFQVIGLFIFIKHLEN